ncbi:hypothetical protein [Paenibacillus mendelii]|uniref:Copper amine oxidase-like N-terminal domain-containing protein n=1 Tax=Paenibacillus mendelii TaxID=206163 RepID=A0ABV6JFD5_9BACL|nr:hypothetical protein [Paenibacillus mendelii]
MRIKEAKPVKVFAALGMIAAIMASSTAGAGIGYAEKPIITSSTPSYDVQSSPVIKPSWSLPLAKFDQGGYSFPVTTALAEEGRVFDYRPLYRVHEGRLLYQNRLDYSISVMKTANGGKYQFPSGVRPVQTDLYGNGLFIARADGMLEAYNFTTSKPVFSVKLGARNFVSTLKSGNMIYVRAGGTLYAVKLPASLLKG